MVLSGIVLPFLLTVVTAMPESGVVRLSRTDYDRLKDAADRAREEPRKKEAVVPPAIEGAAYELRVSPDRIALEVAFDVVVKPSAQAQSRVTLPAAGLLDTLADTGPAAVGATVDDEILTLVFPAPGRYRIASRFLPAETRDGGERSVTFPVLPAASARVTAFGSDALALSTSGGPLEPLGAGASRPLPASSFVRAVVRSAARVTAPAEKPLVLADTVDVVRVERDRVTQRVFARLSVTRAPLPQVVLRVAPGAQVASVSGPSDPSFEAKEDGTVVLSTSAPVAGDAAFSLFLTRPAPQGADPYDLVPTRVEGAATSRSWLLLDPNPLRAQQPRAPDGLRDLARVDLEDLPAFVLPFAAEGTRAFRVSGAAPRLALVAPLRDVVPPPDALLHDAELLTVFGDGGSRVDRRLYRFETRLPHLDVPMPEGEQVLSASVDGTPVAPRMDGAALVLALPPAAPGTRRTVEVTSKSAASVPKKRGEMTVVQRPLPGVASLARWTIVVPADRRYRLARASGISRVAWSEDATVAAPAVSQRTGWLQNQYLLDGVDTRGSKPGDRGRSLNQKLDASGPSIAGTASINVHVVDVNGQPLPGVTVELKGRALRGTRETVTDGSGRGFLPGLPSGSYTARASLSGFTTVERSASVSAGSSVLLSFALPIAGVTSEVVVTGEAPIVDTTKSSIGTTFGGDHGRGGGSTDISGLFRKKPKAEPAPAPAQQRGWMDIKSVEGGVAGGVLGAATIEEAMTVDALANQMTEGIRSLPIEVKGHGKRLLLTAPMVGSQPLEVVLEVKPE